eukprot:353072-Chlamydomonas_euryale.AAC.10
MRPSGADFFWGAPLPRPHHTRAISARASDNKRLAREPRPPHIARKPDGHSRSLPLGGTTAALPPARAAPLRAQDARTRAPSPAPHRAQPRRGRRQTGRDLTLPVSLEEVGRRWTACEGFPWSRGCRLARPQSVDGCPAVLPGTDVRRATAARSLTSAQGRRQHAGVSE